MVWFVQSLNKLHIGNCGELSISDSQVGSLNSNDKLAIINSNRKLQFGEDFICLLNNVVPNLCEFNKLGNITENRDVPRGAPTNISIISQTNPIEFNWHKSWHTHFYVCLHLWFGLLFLTDIKQLIRIHI